MNVYSWALTRLGATRRAALIPRGWPSLEATVRILVLIAVIAVVASVYLLRDHIDFGDVGYPLIAGLSFLGSAGLVVPVPGMASVCTGGVLLNPILVGLVAGSAGTVGELTGYALGYSGRGVLNKGRLYTRMEGWMRRRGWLVLVVLSVVPNPVFDLAGIAAGTLRYPLPRFLGIIWPGKLIKFLAISYACAYGAEGVLGWFGIDTD